ncbi:hypothetical protein Cfor_06071, partial [Coptotermes formosanus]
ACIGPRGITLTPEHLPDPVLTYNSETLLFAAHFRQPARQAEPVLMDYTALRTYTMLVNQSPTFVWDSNVPRHVPARHFVSWFQFLGEVISDTYNAGLASVLSTPRYEAPIETIENLASRNVIWAGNHVSWTWSIEEDDNPDLQTMRNFRCLTNEQLNETGQRSEDMAFGIERLHG